MTEKIRPTIICPECCVEWRDEAPGSVQCPNPECRITFKVDDYGTPRLRSTIICPKCGEVCRDEGWESVICPNPECQEAFEVDKYGMPIQYTVSIKCLNCGESWEDDAPGTVECPTCGKSFDVNSKGLPAVLTTIICPECEEEWQDEVPGSVQCPNRACREAFEVDKYGIPIQYTVFIKCLNCGESWRMTLPELLNVRLVENLLMLILKVYRKHVQQSYVLNVGRNGEMRCRD